MTTSADPKSPDQAASDAHSRTAAVGSPLFIAIWFTLAGALVGVIQAFLLDPEIEPFSGPLTVGLVIMALALASGYWLTTAPATRIASGVYSVVLALTLSGLYWLSQWTFGWGLEGGAPGELSWVGGAVIFLVSLPFFRTTYERRQPANTYPSLFEFAWNTTVMVVVAGLFMGLFALVLFTWMALFELIGIEFFTDLFTDRYVAYALYTAAFGTAIGILREQESIILTVRGVLFALLQLLAPVAALAALLFLITLLFTGLEPLWETGSTISVLLVVAVGTLVLVNATLGDGERDGTRGLISMISVRALSVALPGFVALALILLARDYQDGSLSIQDILSGVLFCVFALYGLLYALSALLPRMFPVLSQGNILLAGIALLVSVFVQTPFFNPYEWKAQDMVERLRDGRISALDLDFGALKFRLGAAGQKALADIARDTSLADRETVDKQLAILEEAAGYWDWQANRLYEDRPLSEGQILRQVLPRIPADVEPDPKALALLEIHQPYQIRRCVKAEHYCVLLSTDIVGDEALELSFVLLTEDELFTYVLAPTSDGEWMSVSNDDWYFDEDQREAEYARIRSALEAGSTAIGQTTLTLRIPVIGGVAMPLSFEAADWLRSNGIPPSFAEPGTPEADDSESAITPDASGAPEADDVVEEDEPPRPEADETDTEEDNGEP